MTQEDLKRINQCRRQHNKLGFCYQLSFVKLLNRFPVQQPFEATEDILNYVSAQIGIECTDRDAPYVLDGLLYNESDLPLGEHYTDTHGYTENNFAAFAMLGRRFAPRIRGLHKQRVYRIDAAKNYQALTPLVCRSGRTIHMNWIVDQWDRLGHFYASLESGHTTASTAMKKDKKGKDKDKG
jgi:TnpA family transposase